MWILSINIQCTCLEIYDIFSPNSFIYLFLIMFSIISHWNCLQKYQFEFSIIFGGKNILQYMYFSIYRYVTGIIMHRNPATLNYIVFLKCFRVLHYGLTLTSLQQCCSTYFKFILLCISVIMDVLRITPDEFCTEIQIFIIIHIHHEQFYC